MGSRAARGSETAGPGPGYLTVHDYIEQVHTWLMSIRGDILRAITISKALLDQVAQFEGHEEDKVLEKWEREEKLFFVGDLGFLTSPMVIMDEMEWMDTFGPYPTNLKYMGYML